MESNYSPGVSLRPHKSAKQKKKPIGNEIIHTGHIVAASQHHHFDPLHGRFETGIQTCIIRSAIEIHKNRSLVSLKILLILFSGVIDQPLLRSLGLWTAPVRMQNSIKGAMLHRATWAFYEDPVFRRQPAIILFYNSLRQNVVKPRPELWLGCFFMSHGIFEGFYAATTLQIRLRRGKKLLASSIERRQLNR